MPRLPRIRGDAKVRRRKQGRLRKLNYLDRQRKKARNERRGRISKVVAWEKSHVHKMFKPWTDTDVTKSKKKIAVDSLVDALKTLGDAKGRE